VGDSIRMVMECNSQDRDRKANDQKVDKLFAHQPNNLPISKKLNKVYTVMFHKANCISKPAIYQKLQKLQEHLFISI